MEQNAAKLTPLMKQYYDIKSKNPGLILFFRLGDFYEMFDDDARLASPIMGVALTARHGVPMCGVPYHAAGNYLSRLIKAGKKVAICEQIGVSENAKSKLFERKIVRVITPGTVLEDNMLDAVSSNYLACVFVDKNTWAMACADISTGEFWVSQNGEDKNFSALACALAAVRPSEILSDKHGFEELNKRMEIPGDVPLTAVERPSGQTPPASWPGAWEKRELALSAAMALINYISIEDASFKAAFIPFYKEFSRFLSLDENAIRNLEIADALSGGRKGSLWQLMDFTDTAPGSRLLKNRLLNPLLDLKEIQKSHDCVEGFLNTPLMSEQLSDVLKETSDIERIAARTAAGTAGPRDLAGLRRTLGRAGSLEKWFSEYGFAVPELQKKAQPLFEELKELYLILEKGLEDNPPIRMSDGGIIKSGFNEELDGLRDLKKETDFYLEGVCKSEKEATGISNLKIGYSAVFGYYLEVSRGQAGKIPYAYKRTQSLTNAERFTTPALKELEVKILTAQDRILRLESGLFAEIRIKMAEKINVLRAFASCISELDLLNSFARAARAYKFTKPVMSEKGPLSARNVRHPVVEQALPPGSFVPNDISVGEDPQVMIITGPNMGGKSVFLKQTALLVILAQAGSFVPADSAEMGITDRIMTRIGAQDALLQGDSTFMVEMKETARILAGATPRSLVLLDEVGRGTSTYDGVSIAWAITEFLYKPAGGPKVLFATHYFELTDLASKYPKIKNYNAEVHEYKDNTGASKIAFMYKIKEGPADKSYGIHVAELAGIAQSVIVRAKKVLKDLEAKQGESISKKERNFAPDIFSSPLMEEIRLTDTDKLTPLEALQLINEWKKRIND